MLANMEANGNNYELEDLPNLDLIDSISKNKSAWSNLDVDVDIIEAYTFAQHIFNLVIVDDFDKEPSFTLQ